MKSNLLRLIACILFMLACGLMAFGQASSSISGTITDQNGAVVAGAAVTVKNGGTGAEFKTTTTHVGSYTVPSLLAGDYTVSVSAQGFKQSVVQDVNLDAGVPATVNIVLEVGAPTESVVVQGGGEILQTQSATISTTLSTAQIAQLPLQSRNTIYYLTLLPGVSSPGTASPRNSTINGLPSSAYNITIDGLNTQDNLNKNTDGFFSYINPTVDAVQEVTLSTATPGAESAGGGAIQIKFVTRSGNNEFHGSTYYYHRNTAFNTNYWFTNRDTTPYDVETAKQCVNGTTSITGTPSATTLAINPATQELYDPKKCHAPKAVVLFNQFGGRIGGPITIPKIFNGKDRAFFFVNFEEFRLPSSVTRSRTILNPTTQTGVFQYTVNGVTQTKNLLTLAAANGQTATIDPTIGKLLADIQSSTSGTGGVTQNTDPNLQTFTFNNYGLQRRYFPTVRLDFNLSSKHHLENTWNYQSYVSSPDPLNNVDPAFPGFPNQGGQISNRFTEGLTLRSTLSPRLVNEARFGLTGGTVLFFPEVNKGQFTNQGGFNLGISAAGISNATVSAGPERRNAPVWDYADTLTWTKGAHNFTFGGQLTQAGLWITDSVVVPGITFGIIAGDPALSMFTTANFPGASTTQLTAAQNIYAVLTGRVTAINASAVLDEKTNKYGYQADQVRRARQRDLAFFGQDSWRARPNLTLTGGLRWELQFPFTIQNSVYATSTVAGLYGVSGPNLFKPGTLAGSPTQFTNLTSGSQLYKMQWGNVGPSIGFAWSPVGKNGLLKRLIGEGGQTVIRGGYSVAFERQGSASVLNFYDTNPGLFFAVNRNSSNGNLVTGTGTDVLPVLLRDGSRLGPPSFPAAPTYPFTGQIGDQINIFDPNLKVPYAQSWSFGIQRELSKDTALEVRYVHTSNLQQWFGYNYNEVNIVENGFLNEFKLAQANLQENIKAGRGNTFKYFGPGTNTSPLPIYLAYFSGIPASQAGDPTKYTSANFGSSTFYNNLAMQNPLPGTAAGTGSAGLQGTAAFRQNALNAGLPANFFVVNPGLLGGTFTESNGGYSRYDGATVELRRRMSKGLLLAANYTFAKGFTGTRYSFRQGWVNGLSTLNGGTLKHAFKANWIYELPVGKGRMLLGNPSGFVGGLVDKVLGGWEMDGTARLQTGANLNLGNVRLVGMTQKDVQKAFKMRFDDANRRAYIFPQDIIDNTILAFSTSATTASGYAGAAPSGRYFAPANSSSCIQVVTGDCAGQTVFVQGPKFTRFDLSAIKRFKFNERWNFEFRVEVLNAFNNIDFLGNSNIAPTSNQAFGQQVLGSAYRDVNNTQDPGGRLIQLVGRINF
jgi:hypothetical protein